MQSAGLLAAARLGHVETAGGEFALERSLGDLSKDILQQTIDRGYQDFVGRVAKARKMTPEAVEAALKLARRWASENKPGAFEIVTAEEKRPSRALLASADGTAARPSTPDSSHTSTSTVGLPRLSRISRANTLSMVVINALLS